MVATGAGKGVHIVVLVARHVDSGEGSVVDGLLHNIGELPFSVKQGKTVIPKGVRDAGAGLLVGGEGR